MNTSTFYIVLLCFLSRNLLNAEHSEEKNNQDLEDRRYKMFGNETDDKVILYYFQRIQRLFWPIES